MKLFTTAQLKRIIGNTGFAFFSAFSAAQIAGAGESALKMALLLACIQGGLAFFQEMMRQCDEPENKTGVKKLSSFLLL